MELEKAINRLKHASGLGYENHEALETVLEALEDNKNTEEKAMKILKENSIGRYKKEENGEITHIIAVEDFKKILHLIERQQEQINELKTKSIPKKKIEDEIKLITDRDDFDYVGTEWRESEVVDFLKELLVDK